MQFSFPVLERYRRNTEKAPKIAKKQFIIKLDSQFELKNWLTGSDYSLIQIWSKMKKKVQKCFK